MLKPSNIGMWIFFFLNMSLIWLVLRGAPMDVKITIWSIYVISVLVSISPVGEYFLCLMAGGRPIKRTDMLLKMKPILEVVYEVAKEKTPSLPKNIRLWMINDPTPNAFAIGRKTICVTEGVFDLPDNVVVGFIAHEIGHLAKKHSVILLIIGGANVFITGFIMILKIISWMIAGIGALTAILNRSCLSGCFIGIFSAIAVAAVWLWARFCMIFVKWSMRANEYAADKYTFEIGFGYELALALDTNFAREPTNTFIKALYATHPPTDDRIARLQQMGVNYSRY
jgi:heat shock protein HtpX